MKKQQPIHGAQLRARTRAFLCALTLALLPFATVFASIPGDASAVGDGFSNAFNDLPFTNSEITREGTLYTFHKAHNPAANDHRIIHLEFYTANEIAVGEYVGLSVLDRSGANGTVRMYDATAGNGSYAQITDPTNSTTKNFYITQTQESYGMQGGLYIYRKAHDEWIVFCYFLNSNDKYVTPSYGTAPTVTVNFAVGDSPWDGGTLNKYSASGAFGNRLSCTPTASSGYKFGIWSNGLYYNGQAAFRSWDNGTTYTAYFVPESAASRTVTVTADPADGTAGLWYRAVRGISTPSVVTSASVFEGVPVTLVATQTGSNPFHHWEDEGGNTLDPSVILSSNTTDGVTTTQVIVPTGKNTTYTAVFAPAAPSTYTVTWKSEDGESTLETDADLAADAATSFDGAIPTKAGNAQYSYTFDGWTTVANGGGTFYADGETPAVSGDATYYAHFSQSTNTYTVTVDVSPAGYGTVDHATVTSVPYGTNITNSTNTVTINGTTVTATPTAADAQYTYTFDSWGNGSATVTGNLTVTANFTRTTNNYTVAASVSPVGAGSVSGTGTFAYGTDVTLTATPTNRRWQFVRWTESASEVGTAASYTISSIAAAHTLVAEFEEIPVTIADNESSSYYASTLSTFSATMDFRLMRTFKAGMWNTVCFPFDLTAAQRGNSDMSGVTFYTLTSVTGDAAVGLDFNVTAVTTETMTARTPYLVQFTGADIVNPVFEDVTLAANAFTNNSGTDIGQNFTFNGTLCPTALEQGQANGYLFLGQDNALYWPNTANPIRAFRAYFYTSSPVVQSVHPRARIVVKGETPTDVEERIADGNGSAPRKYLHNGVLVIEKNGIRYNAVGQPLSE